MKLDEKYDKLLNAKKNEFCPIFNINRCMEIKT